MSPPRVGSAHAHDGASNLDAAEVIEPRPACIQPGDAFDGSQKFRPLGIANGHCVGLS